MTANYKNQLFYKIKNYTGHLGLGEGVSQKELGSKNAKN